MIEIERMRTPPHGRVSAREDRIVWAPVQSIWTLAMTGVGLVGAVFTAAIDTVLVFFVTTAITIGLGHSVGMHRLLIHRSFKTSKPVEYVLLWLGVLVGMAGPIGMTRTHDLRDWAQRQTGCHDYFAHRAGPLADAWRQMHCKIVLDHPPEFRPEPALAGDPVHRFMERTWRWQQLPVALALFALGGWAWVIWGVCLRVAVSLAGHWAVGYVAHRDGHQGWRVEGAGVQGYNLPLLAWITFGESWHANHHAFPGSARLGIERGQCDPGWRALQVMERLGLVRGLVTPARLPWRAEVRRVDPILTDAPGALLSAQEASHG